MDPALREVENARPVAGAKANPLIAVGSMMAIAANFILISGYKL
jgi:hypothetical protein